MNTKFSTFKILILLFIGIAASFYGFNCSSTNEIQLGMSKKEVVQKLGQPDSKSILDGKLLREIEDDEDDIDLKKHRIVYSYEKTGIQIWFQAGKVSGATKNGISIF